jgi:pyridoxamine 5'-phosphate oxidase
MVRGVSIGCGSRSVVAHALRAGKGSGPAGAPSKDAAMTQPDADPYARFAAWMTEATASEPNDPNALCLATATPEGRPSARMVLLKGVDDRGFVFYTNLESRKGRELTANPFAALCFHWKTLQRSVRIEGPIEPVSAAEADAYYASRARGSRIGAWASRQSRPLEGRFALEKAVADYTLKFGLSEIPRPEFWSGFRVLPERLEFWRDMPFRLHERNVFIRDGAGWRVETLYP